MVGIDLLKHLGHFVNHRNNIEYDIQYIKVAGVWLKRMVLAIAQLLWWDIWLRRLSLVMRVIFRYEI